MTVTDYVVDILLAFFFGLTFYFLASALLLQFGGVA